MDSFVDTTILAPGDQYTLRVHTNDEELIVVANWVRNHSTCCLVVREHATRTHFHALFGTRKSIEQWRKDFKKQFPHLEGNKHYSLKNVKSQIGIQDYLCKGGDHLGEWPDIMEQSPYWTDTVIYAHHKSYHERHLPEVKADISAKQGNDVMVSDHTPYTLPPSPFTFTFYDINTLGIIS